MIAALSFLLDYEKIEDNDNDDSDASSGEDDPNPRTAQVVISKESIYKVRYTLYIYIFFFLNSRGHSTVTNNSHYHNCPHG
jgi:hypothetical protein